MIHNVSIIKNQWTLIPQMGVWVTSILATGDLRIRASKLDGSIFETELVSGMTFDVKGGYSSISMISSISQTAKVWLSENQLNWSPQESKAVGSTALSSSTVRCFYGAPQELVPQQSGRKRVTIYSPEDIFIGGEGVSMRSAIKIPAGTTRYIETQGRIMAFSNDRNMGKVSLSKLSEQSVVSMNADYSGTLGRSVRMGSTGDGGGESRIWMVDIAGKLISMRLSDKQVFDSGLTGLSGVGSMQNGAQVQLVKTENGKIVVLTIGADNEIDKLELNVESGGVSSYSAFGDYLAFVVSGRMYFGSKSAGVNLVTAPDSEAGLPHYTYVFEGGEIIVGYKGASYRSTDGGVNWSGARQHPLYKNNNSSEYTQDPVTGDVFITAQHYAYRSRDQGATWHKVFSGVSGGFISIGGVMIFYGTDGITVGNYYGEHFKIMLPPVEGKGLAIGSDGVLYAMPSRLVSVAGESVSTGGLDVALMMEAN